MALTTGLSEDDKAAIRDQIETTQEAMEELANLLRHSQLEERFGYFRAYGMADLEGQNGGWLGSNFLYDLLTELKDNEELEEGWNPYDESVTDEEREAKMEEREDRENRSHQW